MVNNRLENRANKQWTKILDWVIPTKGNSYTFNDSLNNYSEVMFLSRNSESKNWNNSVIFPVSELLQLTANEAIALSNPVGGSSTYYSVCALHIESDMKFKCDLSSNANFTSREICVYAR